MKMILAGLGTFGSIWYKLLKDQYPALQIAVVEADEDKKRLVQDGDAYYHSLTEAIEKEQPVFLLNATPPRVHSLINRIAFDYRLPVLCEKPISDTYESAVLIVERACREQIPFMIAENYRWFPIVRRTRQLIEGGTIGTVNSARIEFYRNHQTDSPYFFQMENPFLEDIAVHHFDMLRYLFGSDGTDIYAQCTNPANSGYTVHVGLHALLSMENHIHVVYTGGFGTKGTQTPWYGSWRIEGSEGALLLDTQLICERGDDREVIDIANIEERNCLDEFLDALQNGRTPEASGEDYLHSQAIVFSAAESHRTGTRAAIKSWKGGAEQ